MVVAIALVLLAVASSDMPGANRPGSRILVSDGRSEAIDVSTLDELRGLADGRRPLPASAANPPGDGTRVGMTGAADCKAAPFDRGAAIFHRPPTC